MWKPLFENLGNLGATFTWEPIPFLGNLRLPQSPFHPKSFPLAPSLFSQCLYWGTSWEHVPCNLWSRENVCTIVSNRPSKNLCLGTFTPEFFGPCRKPYLATFTGETWKPRTFTLGPWKPETFLKSYLANLM